MKTLATFVIAIALASTITAAHAKGGYSRSIHNSFSSSRSSAYVYRNPYKSEAMPTDANGYFITPEIFRKVPFNLETLLEAVLVGPNFDKAEFAKLEAAVSEKISNKIVRPSQLPGWNVSL
ncbi:MAG: hypothetical protein WDM76_03235 [Limisphaerales bacterium]